MTSSGTLPQMRSPARFVEHSRERLGQAAAVALAKYRRGRLGRGVAAVLAKHRRGRLAHAVARALAKHRRERLGQAVAFALVVLLAGGTAAAVALLPSKVAGTAAEGGSRAGEAPSRFAAGQLVAHPKPRRGGRAHYRRTTSKRVPASAQPRFMPLYREAGRTFGVSWRLLASIHRQETAFSTAPSTYHGLNAFGCCAGPMQFNVTNGPPSTWELYRHSYRRGDRPRRYPHRTRRHPSIYDDFDAIMAAGALLRDSGASESLDGGSWSAAYAYYGHDLFGIEYASQVIARARGWERDGFCLNCAVDESLVAEYDDAYGVDARRVLLADERREKQEKKRKKRARAEARRKRERAEAREKAARAQTKRKQPRRSSPREPARPEPRKPQPEVAPNPEPSTAPPAVTEAPPPPPPPPPPNCTGLKKLLGCGG
ncbi:MAG TPA: hypothetical protein VGR11_14675 [Solirubrobacteraceae bacterium]|nr:hypothetical protein [Solirubrobacteraceae bacterium]